MSGQGVHGRGTEIVKEGFLKAGFPNAEDWKGPRSLPVGDPGVPKAKKGLEYGS